MKEKLMSDTSENGKSHRRKRARRSETEMDNDFGYAEPGGAPSSGGPATTGRYLVLLREDAAAAGIKALSESTNLSVVSTADFESGKLDVDTLENAEIVFFDKLAVAMVDSPLEQLNALRITTAAEESPILAVEPERYVHAFSEGSYINDPGTVILPPSMPSQDSATLTNGSGINYFLGYRDAVNFLVDKLVAGSPEGLTAEAQAALDESEITWGLQVTKVDASRYSGKGIRVAVLDTGLELGHPDFAGRNIVSKSFVQGQAVQPDVVGHGTHCIGTACGTNRPSRLPRYGIAYEAEIYAGKVLNNQGSGTDTNILNGINWAVTNGCAIISMSLGASLCNTPNPSYSTIFETVAQRALAAGTLIIAAAGNDSKRPVRICPVSHPANCPSIMAVGALDQNLNVAFFSNGGLYPRGGQIDIAAPGVNVYSSYHSPNFYARLSGTSMATPHVTGIAALWAEAKGVRGRTLQALLLQSARRLRIPARDVGAGLVQAP
jgi:subtilisin family serine protease